MTGTRAEPVTSPGTPRDSMALIEETFAPLAGRRILDIGCGSGALAKALATRGAEVTGIDPSAEAIAAAQEAVPAATFRIGGAESLPFASGSFEGAVFLNSLHHVPQAVMSQALLEAARAIGAGGLVLVIEPLATGSFFSAFRPLEDETAVRAQAQEAVARALAGGAFALVREVDYLRRERFADFEAFLGRVLAADQSRQALLRERRADTEAAFHGAAIRDGEGRFVLDQPLRAQVLRPVRMQPA